MTPFPEGAKVPFTLEKVESAQETVPY